ncbi:hypothetical protein [Haloarchaeobius sp. FL176]|uniref:hypothetical protein n=1 Tax=Haloarchaeobius sp. FL176 TaxID=2967129 RepID=UPI0021483C07|nr:hypothetical protein [Haloarchaeobius sp. FL176]
MASTFVEQISDLLLGNVFRGDELADEFDDLPRAAEVREVVSQDGELSAYAAVVPGFPGR